METDQIVSTCWVFFFNVLGESARARRAKSFHLDGDVHVGGGFDSTDHGQKLFDGVGRDCDDGDLGTCVWCMVLHGGGTLGSAVCTR